VKEIERMLVSAHVDGEVESPWKERIEQKLVQDPSWSAEAEKILRLKAALASAPEPDFTQAQERVSRIVQARAPRVVTLRRLPLVWMSAAAALLVLAAGTGYWLGSRNTAAATPQISELQVQVPRQLELKLSGEGQLIMASTLQGSHR